MIKKTIPYLLFALMILSVISFFVLRTESDESNISEKDTDLKIEEIEKQYKPKEVLILFKEEATKEEIDQTISDVNGTVLDSMDDIKNYRVEIPSSDGTEDLLSIIEKLNQNPLVEMADLNEVAATIDETPSLEQTAETGSAFEQALNIYNKEASIYYSSDKTYMFLYPTGWSKVNDKIISKPSAKKAIVYTNEFLKNELFDQKVEVYLEKDEEKGFVFEGVIDRYERDNLIISRYEVKKDSKTYFKSFIQAGDRFFYFQPNSEVTIDEFSLILDSFLLNN